MLYVQFYIGFVQDGTYQSDMGGTSIPLLSTTLIAQHHLVYQESLGQPFTLDWVFINEHPIGVMQGKEANIELPPAKVIKSLFKYQQ